MCTPLVTCPTGLSCGSICGHRLAQMREETPPWIAETPFWNREPRMASAVMLKSGLPDVRPSSSSRSGAMPSCGAQSSK